MCRRQSKSFCLFISGFFLLMGCEHKEGSALIQAMSAGERLFDSTGAAFRLDDRDLVKVIYEGDKKKGALITLKNDKQKVEIRVPASQFSDEQHFEAEFQNYRIQGESGTSAPETKRVTYDRSCILSMYFIPIVMPDGNGGTTTTLSPQYIYGNETVMADQTTNYEFLNLSFHSALRLEGEVLVKLTTQFEKKLLAETNLEITVACH